MSAIDALPDGRLVRSRVVSEPGQALAAALERSLTGYAVLEPQDALLLDADAAGVIAFRDGVPVGAYHGGTDRGGPAALADLAVQGPYSADLYATEAGTLAPVTRGDRSIPPGMAAERLAGDTDLADRTLAAADEHPVIGPESPTHEESAPDRDPSAGDRPGRGRSGSDPAAAPADPGRTPSDPERSTPGAERSSGNPAGSGRADSGATESSGTARPSDSARGDRGAGGTGGSPAGSDRSADRGVPRDPPRRSDPAAAGDREDRDRPPAEPGRTPGERDPAEGETNAGTDAGGADAVAAFLEDDRKIEAIREQARGQARERADEWGLTDHLAEPPEDE